MQKPPTPSRALATAADVRRVCGDLADHKVIEILACEPDIDALEQAVAWASGDDENTPLRHLAPTGAAATVYEILTADEEAEEEQQGPRS